MDRTKIINGRSILANQITNTKPKNNFIENNHN
jgi:hypothetical protein